MYDGVFGPRMSREVTLIGFVGELAMLVTPGRMVVNGETGPGGR